MGTDDPALPARRGRLPRRALRRLAAATSRATTTCWPHPAGDHRRASTARYLEAGADIIETNTFNSQRHLAGRLRHGGAGPRAEPRAAHGSRGARPTRSRPRTGRPRFVAGALGPTNRTASLSPDVNDPGFRNVTLRRAGRGLRRGGPRPGRRRRGPDPGRDDLRHAQRQGGDLRPRDGASRSAGVAAGDDLRHDHRRLRPHALRPDHRGVLELGAPRAAARRSASTARSAPSELRPYVEELSRIADSFVCALPERRPAQRLRRVRRDAGETAAHRRASSPRAGCVNIVGGCCGTTPDAHRAHRARRSRGLRAAPCRRRSSRAAGSARPRAAQHRPRQPVRQRRRAHQRHRLGAVPQA